MCICIPCAHREATGVPDQQSDAHTPTHLLPTQLHHSVASASHWRSVDPSSITMQAAEHIDTPAVCRAVWHAHAPMQASKLVLTTCQKLQILFQASRTQHGRSIYTPAAHRAATGEPAPAQDPACLAPALKLPESAAAPFPQLHAHETQMLWVSERGLVDVAAPHVEVDACHEWPSNKQSAAGQANS